MFYTMLKFFAPILLAALALWAIVGQLQAAEAMQRQRYVECLEMLAGGLVAPVTECK